MKVLTQRVRRVAENIRAILSEKLVIDSHNIPELEGSFITITEVVPSSDLRNAKVYVGALGGDEIETAKILNKFSGKLSSMVAKNISTKFSPKLVFYPEDNYKKFKKIDDLIKMHK